MACGCKNKAANASTNVVKNAPTQEAKPEKTSNGSNTARIIRREIR